MSDGVSHLTDKLAVLPDKPGVYLFKDSAGRIIYIGKAKSLRNRVRSYFTGHDDGRYQYPRLVAAIRDVELLLTHSEVEAWKTEASLIKLHRPKFNIDLRDDKSYPYIKVTREPFPRILLTRKPNDPPPGDVYGPYTDVFGTRHLLRTLKGILQIRDCNLPLTESRIAAGKFKLCLDYHIGRCGGPCEAKVSPDTYANGVARFVSFLRGRHEDVVDYLESEMNRLAAEHRFEEAALARDRLRAARQFSERQPRIDPDPVDIDAVGLVREDAYAAIVLIIVRGGRIVGQAKFHLERTVGLTDGELLGNFLIRHYESPDQVPDEILIPLMWEDAALAAELLTLTAGRRVVLHHPQRGMKARLAATARVNAEQVLAERRLIAEKRDFVPRSVKALQEVLHLEHSPMWIETFDVSHLAGVDSVAAMVVFRAGQPFRSEYRLFRIKSFTGIDDFAAIAEAVGRRYRRLLSEPSVATIDDDDDDGDDRLSRLPDLVLIDGGIGQLNRAREVLTELGLPDMPVIGLAKRLEEIYLPGDPLPLALPKTSSALRLIQRARDEAHRFCITRQRLLRGKRQVKSRLDDVPGIGPIRRSALLKTFGSLKRLATASVEEIAAVRGMSRRAAEQVKETLTS